MKVKSANMSCYNVSEAYFINNTKGVGIVGVYLTTYRVLKMNPASSSQQVPDSNILCVISKTEVLSFFLQNPHICSTQVQRQFFICLWFCSGVYDNDDGCQTLANTYILLTPENYIRKFVVNYRRGIFVNSVIYGCTFCLLLQLCT